jgi:hypothetical protein
VKCNFLNLSVSWRVLRRNTDYWHNNSPSIDMEVDDSPPMDFREISYLKSTLKFIATFMFLLKTDNKTDSLYEDICTFFYNRDRQ